MTHYALCLLFVAGCLLAACGGPVGPFAGGRLSGDIGPGLVEVWPVEATTLQLETRPEDPHSITVWFASIGPRLYVPTSMILGPKRPVERSWVEHVARDPAVRVRVEGVVYERVAVRVAAGAEFDEARAALERKYELDADERDPDREVWIYRMDPRSSGDGDD